MSKQVMQQAADALWVLSEHDALHFGENHNTVVQGRAAIEELRAAIAKPEVEPMGYVHESAHFHLSQKGGHARIHREAGDLFKVPMYFTPPDTEAMRRDAERYRWLCNAKGLELRSDGSNWCKHGRKFIAPFSMAANGTRYGAFSSLDEMIDAAIAAQGGWE